MDGQHDYRKQGTGLTHEKNKVIRNIATHGAVETLFEKSLSCYNRARSSK
jgi:hypothetical protein